MATTYEFTARFDFPQMLINSSAKAREEYQFQIYDLVAAGLEDLGYKRVNADLYSIIPEAFIVTQVFETEVSGGEVSESLRSNETLGKAYYCCLTERVF